MRFIIILLSLYIAFSTSLPALAVETEPRITDREIVERLTRVEEGQKAILREMDKRFEALDKRFESIDKRFESIDAQFDRIDAQFERIVNIMLGILGAFVVLLGGTIWFALWDRRTMIRPFETKVKVMEDEIAGNRSKLHALIDSFRTLSKTDDKVAEILKRFNLL